MRAWWLVALAACAGTDSAFTDDGDSGVDCGDNPPTFDEITITDAGEIDFSSGTRPAIQVAATANDPDGDLHIYTARVWYDTLVDGDLPEFPEISRTIELSPDKPCGVENATAGLLLPVGGTDVPAGTEVEFGLILEDAAGHPSHDEPVIAVFETPSAD